jgi:anti-sigma B factor antagonist
MDADGSHPAPDGDADVPVTVVERDGRTVVSVSGDVDAVAAPALREQLFAVIDQATGAVRLDMGGVDFLDSVGISVLVAAFNRADDVGVTFELAAVPPSSLRVLEITRLTDVFTIIA